MDESLEVVGARIREARLAHRPPLRLVDVAGERLTAGMLSKIERGRVSASLGTLRYLAGRLGVPLASLFDSSGRGDGHGGVAGDRTAPAAPAALGAALGAARAALWLGDPADAERRAAAVAGAIGPDGHPRLRAAALGAAAEAALERGSAESATRRLTAASEVLAAAPPQDGVPDAARGAVEAHLAWVLGLLERRRGRLDGAARAWTQGVERLGGGEDTAGGAGATLLRARLLLELGGLHAVAGTPQTAGSLIRRAVLALRWLQDAGAVARDALTAHPAALDAPEPEAAADAPDAPDAPDAGEAVVEVLAAVAFARRLEERAQRELTRLDRPQLRRASGTPADVPHSRHLV